MVLNKETIKLVVLIILDGWGVKESYEGNGVALAAKKNFQGLITQYPATVLNSKAGRSRKKAPSCFDGHNALAANNKNSGSADNLAAIIAKNKLKQLYLAESDKFAYVDLFIPKGEQYDIESVLVPSPNINSYTEKPEMSASEIAKKAIKAIGHEKYSFICLNFANVDALAHTGDIEATCRAVEAVDKQINKIIKSALNHNGTVLITADHGNGEEMLDMATGQANKEHTNNPVPFIVVGGQYAGRSFGWPEAVDGDLSLVKPRYSLEDIAPTILKILDIKKHQLAVGKSMI